MFIHTLIPALLVSAGAALGFASTAAAESGSAACQDNGPTSVCARSGHSAITASPTQNTLSQQRVNNIPQGWANDARWAQSGPGGSSPIGSGNLPPVLALD